MLRIFKERGFISEIHFQNKNNLAQSRDWGFALKPNEQGSKVQLALIYLLYLISFSSIYKELYFSTCVHPRFAVLTCSWSPLKLQIIPDNICEFSHTWCKSNTEFLPLAFTGWNAQFQYTREDRHEIWMWSLNMASWSPSSAQVTQCSVYGLWQGLQGPRSQQRSIHGLQCDRTKQVLLETTWLSQLQQRDIHHWRLLQRVMTLLSQTIPRLPTYHGGVRATFGRLNYPVKSFQGREFGECTPLGFLVFGWYA